MDEESDSGRVVGVKGVLLALSAGLVLCGADLSFAVRQSQFAGRVTGISKHTITVSRGNESLEFEIAQVGSNLPKNLKLGDEVTIDYTAQAKGVSLREPGREEAGQVGKSPDKSEKKPVLDDRAAFGA